MNEPTLQASVHYYTKLGEPKPNMETILDEVRLRAAMDRFNTLRVRNEKPAAGFV